jgi:hypothetical protein
VLEGIVILAIVSARMVMNNAYARERAFEFFRRIGSRGAPLGPAIAAGRERENTRNEDVA